MTRRRLKMVGTAIALTAIVVAVRAISEYIEIDIEFID